MRGVLIARRATAAYAVLVVADTALAELARDRLRRLTKPLIMPALMVGRDRPTRRALALSGAGYVALLGLNAYLWPRTGRYRHHAW